MSDVYGLNITTSNTGCVCVILICNVITWKQLTDLNNQQNAFIGICKFWPPKLFFDLQVKNGTEYFLISSSL